MIGAGTACVSLTEVRDLHAPWLPPPNASGTLGSALDLCARPKYCSLAVSHIRQAAKSLVCTCHSIRVLQVSLQPSGENCQLDPLNKYQLIGTVRLTFAARLNSIEAFKS